MKPHCQESSLEALPTVEEVITAFNIVSTPGSDPDHGDESDQRLLLALIFCPEEKAGEQEASHYAHKGLEDQSERPRFVFQSKIIIKKKIGTHKK